jgi:uncharacterized membrane protein (UPF0127 family)
MADELGYLTAMRRLLALVIMAGLGCSRVSADTRPNAAAADAGRSLPAAHLDVEGVAGKSFGLDVELALTPHDREVGLMYRKQLPHESGMLFVFKEAEPHSFWMKNTLIPLDMIFAAEGGEVLGVVSNAEPMTLVPRVVQGASKYVLEVNGGWAQEKGIGKGSHLILPDIRDDRVE